MTEDIFFRGPAHKQRLVEAIERLEKVERNGKADPWYAAALYILSADGGTWTAVQPFIRSSGIRFDEISEKLHLSSGEITLIDVASNLFRDEGQIDLSRFTNLDERNFKLAIDAIKIRRYSLMIEELK